MSKKVKIRLEDWDYTCGDGCCYEWGSDIIINGEKLDFRGDPSVNIEHTLETILTHLGYKVEIE